jgi:phosphoglycolate phosphatase
MADRRACAWRRRVRGRHDHPRGTEDGKRVAHRPFEIFEECAQLAPGDRLDYRFEAQRPVIFQIYYMDGLTFIAPVSRDDVTGILGVFQPAVSNAAIAAVGSGSAGGDHRLPDPAAAGPAALMAAAPHTLLFDLDGTLTDNYAGISRSIAYALEQLDTSIPDAATLRRCVGPPLRDSFRWLLDTDDAAVVEQAIGLYRERFADVGWRENVVYDGIADAFTALAAGTHPHVRMHVEARGLRAADRDALRVLGASRRCVWRRPGRTPRRQGQAARAPHGNRESRPAHSIMIGDRAHDIRAARMNGTRSAGVLWGYGSREELAGADAIVTTPAELPQVLTAMAAAIPR